MTTYRCTDHKVQEKYLQGHLYQYYLAGELYSLTCLTEFHQACHILCDDSTPDQYDIPASPMASGCIVACHPHQHQEQQQKLQSHICGFVEAQCVLGDGGFIETRQLLDRYCAWAKVAVTMYAFRNVAKAVLEGKGAKSDRRKIAGKDWHGYTEVKWQVCQKEGEQPQQGEGQGNCHDQHQPHSDGMQHVPHDVQEYPQMRRLQTHGLTEFVEAQCVLGDGGFIETRQLLDRYCAWAKVAVTMNAFRNVAKAVLEGKGAKSDRRKIAGKDWHGYTEVKWQVCQKEGEQPQQGEGQGNCHDQHQPHSDGMQHVPQDVQEYPQMRRLQTHGLTEFVEAQCVLGDGGFIETRQLLDRYCAWAKVAVTMNAFRNVAKAVLEGKGAKSDRRKIAGKDWHGYTEVKWQVCQKEGEQPQQGEGQGNCGEVNVICSGRKAQLDINTEGHVVSCLVAWNHWEITTRLPLMLFVSNYISGASEDRATAGTDV